jgi:hypothetical protein
VAEFELAAASGVDFVAVVFASLQYFADFLPVPSIGNSFPPSMTVFQHQHLHNWKSDLVEHRNFAHSPPY